MGHRRILDEKDSGPVLDPGTIQKAVYGDKELISNTKDIDEQKVSELLFSDDPTGALEIIDSRIGADSTGKKLLRDWGRQLMDRQLFDAAASVHRRLTSLFPQDSKAFNALAVSLTMAGDLDEALKAMKMANDMDPSSLSNCLNMGKLHMLRSEWEQALVYLGRAIYGTDGALKYETQQMIDICRDNREMGKEESKSQFKPNYTPPDNESGLHGTREYVSAEQTQPENKDEPASDDNDLFSGWQFESTAAETGEKAEPMPSDGGRATALEGPGRRPCPVQETDSPLKILFVQESPCIRNYKMASALGRRGHRVSLAYAHKKLSEMYSGLGDDVYHESIKLEKPRDIWEISREYDLVHCHNEPDMLTVAALGGHAPVIHDTHDLMSLRQPGNDQLDFMEGLANRAAHGRVYTTPYQRDEVKRLHKAEGPSLVIYNYTSWGDLPQKWLPKLSAQDGGVHFVYEGGIGGNAHRDYSKLLTELDRMGINVHIYPPGDHRPLAQALENLRHIHVHPSVSPKRIIEEMSQYDYGIIPFNLEKGNKRFLDSTIANKLFEYLAAGLPVAASDLQSYRDFFAENPVGLTFNSAGELASSVDKLKRMAGEVDFGKYIRTYEDEVVKLEEFYLQILQGRKAGMAQALDKAAEPTESASGIWAGEPRKDASSHSEAIKQAAKKLVSHQGGADSQTSQPPEPSLAQKGNGNGGLASQAAASPITFGAARQTREEAPGPLAGRPDRQAAPPMPGSEAMSGLAGQISQAIISLDQWMAGNGWAGFDPYDIKSYVINQSKAGQMTAERAQEILAAEQAHPLEVRAELGIQPQVNAKAMGLFLGSYAILQDLMPDRDFSDRIAQCETWLMEHPSEGMSGLCWGYPFDWDSVVVIPEGTPTSVISYHVADAFWELHRGTGEGKWLERCRSVADFLVNDINQDIVDEKRICFSYTPIDFYHVHNASLCVAEYLLRLGLDLPEPKWAELGTKALEFALSDLMEQGFLTYWAKGYEPGPANVGQMDHYHTAAELRSLYRIKNLMPHEPRVRQGFEQYMRLYLDKFFENKTAPKIHPERTYPMDIHAAAEAAYVLGETAREIPEAMEVLERFIPWFLENCRNTDGSFIYRLEQGPEGLRRNRIPYVRWGQAWTMRGLASALAAVAQS